MLCRVIIISALAGLLLGLTGCEGSGGPVRSNTLHVDSAVLDARVRPEIYATVALTTDTTHLSSATRRMIPLLIEAARIMDGLFWREAWGRADSLPVAGLNDETVRFFQLNYGPWDRLNGDKAFIDGVGEKPLGARYYPQDMTKAEFEAWKSPEKKSLYTFIRRDAQGKLVAIPYHVMFKAEVEQAATLLREAAALAEDQGTRNYLETRALALLTDDYTASDVAWLDMRDNALDVIIGPIETYEDQLFGYKASHACYLAVKDQEWSVRLARFAALLPELQRGLPVDDRYKAEAPGSDSQLGAYDVIYYAGDCNAGGKTIAVNLPNDEGLQLKKGTRRLQFKNAMRAKFDRILVPIADVLVSPDQRKFIDFNSFFSEIMFHEVAHGLGIKNTITGKGSVREALLEQHGALEEGKADILGLYMLEVLREKGVVTEGSAMHDYVTFMAGIFRSVRFGASSAHGRANMMRFNFFLERGAFLRNSDGTYSVVEAKMRATIDELSGVILRLQGDGAVEEVRAMMEKKGIVSAELQKDLDRLKAASIPVDVVFEQGMKTLGLAP
ncbi:MAG: Zn-dependent hydrolase [Flavobacteriales bacterium]|nr:Zn-dependent hydrolase [Flavobacteriales bacterium]MBL0034689.1 Zn-dependent hydrolase [Flavobacteriales bacterium]